MKIRKISIMFMMMIMGVGVVFTGCSKDEPVKNTEIEKKTEVEKTTKEPTKQEDSQVTSETVIEMDDDIKAGAKAEGISKKEMLSIVTELTQKDAENYGTDIKTYVEVMKKDGVTPYAAQKKVADYMGISVKELHDADNMSEKMGMDDPNKADYAKPAEVMAELNKVDLTGAGDVESPLIGFHTNTTGEIREVKGNAKEMLLYEANTIINEDEDEFVIEVTYNTNEDFDAIVEYFDGLLKNTEGYMMVNTPIEKVASVMGVIDGQEVSVAISMSETSVVVEFGILLNN